MHARKEEDENRRGVAILCISIFLHDLIGLIIISTGAECAGTGAVREAISGKV
jgi:hypothetical protein